MTRWAGSSLYRILDDPTERQRFAQIMPLAALHDLVRTSYQLDSFYADLPSGNWIDDGYLVTGSCDYPCWWHGFIAIEVDTGRPYALVYKDYIKGCRDCLEVYGASLENIPEPLQKIARSLIDPDS